MFNRYQHFYVVLLCSLGIALNGCATTNMQLPQAEMNAPIKVLVMQSPMTIDRGRLQRVFAPDIKAELSVTDEPIAQGVEHGQQYALTAMDSALAKNPRLAVVAPPQEEEPFIDTIRGRPFETALSQDEADRIRQTTGADALLRFKITDYGLTPVAWRNGYIAFEVTTTLAIAAIIAYSGSTLAKGAAGAYLVQEAIEETAEGYACFWALNKVSRPVRVEAELIWLKPVTTVWKTSNTGLADIKMSRLTGKVGTLERYALLDQSTYYATRDVVSSLTEALADIKSENNQHGFP